MRLSSKIALGIFLLCGIVGTVLGVWAWMRIPSLFNFVLLFTPLAVLGVLVASFIILFFRLRRIWVRIALVAVYVLVPCALVRAAAVYRDKYEQPANQGPYLSWSEDPKTTMTVSWTSSAPTRGEVEYAKAQEPAFVRAGEEAATQFHHVTVRNLEPATSYRYRVPELGSRLSTFTTAPASAGDFAFAVYGDSRPTAGISRHEAVVRQMLEQDRKTPFKFILHTGDIVESPGKGFGWQWHSFLAQIVALAETRPFMVVLGNHEARGGSEGGARTTGQYVHFDENHFWYAFDYGQVHIIGLSTEADIGAGSEQYRWLVDDLEKHAAVSRFIVVCMHKPLATYDPRETYRNTALYEALNPVFEKYGVSVVFAGHVHAYEHLRVDGYDQVISGGGGVLLWNKPAEGPMTLCTETIWHFCTVEATGNVLRITARRIDGSVIEFFDVPPRKGL